MQIIVMARRRFFVEQVRRGVAELTGDDAEHLVRVLRAEVDQIYEISDNESLYLARISTARKSLIEFQVIEELPIPEQNVRLSLLAALFKFDRFEWLVEKATELGVDEILPFDAIRTERGLSQAAAKRRIRWQRIALEASQQARRARLPIVHEPLRYPSAIAAEAGIRLLLDEDASASPLLRVLPAPTPDLHIALMLGPEGGWTDEERRGAIDNGWLACSLGTNILRAETAGIAALSIIQAWANQ